VLDKFIGDALMAVFGVPVRGADDEDRAVRAAIAMLGALKRWNKTRKCPVNIGVGINTDAVVSGNIGSPKRMDYTIIGDGVNLASRLESACKQYGARILISENTYQRLHGVYRVRAVDLVIVKGKTQPVEIFEVLDYHDEESFPHLMEVLEYFREARRLYREQHWDEAIAALTKALAAHPGDTLSQMYLERCRHLKGHPPGEEWDGVWRMTSK